MKKNTRNAASLTLLSLTIPCLDRQQARAHIAHSLRETKNCTKIYTPNPQMLLRAHNSPELLALLRRGDLLLPDGIGLCMGARLLGHPLPCRIAGIDAAYEVLEMAEEMGLSVALLGAAPGVAKRAAACLQKKLPRLRICYTHHGYFDREGKENTVLLHALRTAAPDILFVCFGFPEQEKWIDNHAHTIPTLRLCMGLGGSLDVWSGDRRRAPRAMSTCGLEWLWRTISEPRRARIFLDIPHFLYLILRQSRKENKKAVADHF